MLTPFRRCPIGLATALLTVAAFASAEVAKPSAAYVVKVRADRADSLYRSGEVVRFVLEVTLDEKPVADAELRWRIAKNGVRPVSSGKAKLVDGRATVTATLDEPGFLRCDATFSGPDGRAYAGTGGAGVDPLRIKRSQPTPPDFDAFWAQQKHQLAAVPANPRLTPVKQVTPGVAVFDVQVDALGAPVSGYFAKPESARPRSLPVILLVHGRGVYSANRWSAEAWAKQNFLALDINAHGVPNGRPRAFYDDLANGDLKDYSTRGRESRDSIYFRGVFLRLIRALDFLTAQPEWDGETVVVHGVSQGGYQAIAAAGLDARVTFIAAGVPAGSDLTGVTAERATGWPWFLATGERPPANVVDAVRYYDAVNFAMRTKAGAVFTVAFLDRMCPPTGVYAAYNSFGGPKSIFTDVAGGHRPTPERSKAMQGAMAKGVMDHVKAQQAGRRAR